MPLPHSLFGARVHSYNKRHWWQRHHLPKIRHRPVATDRARQAPAPDRFTRMDPVVPPPVFGMAPAPDRPPSPSPPSPALAAHGNGHTGVLRHFAEVGYDDAVEQLQDADLRLVMRVADAACAAEEFEVARHLFEMAHARGGPASRVPRHLQKRAERAAQEHNAAAQRLYLSLWMETQHFAWQALARGCLQACELNPALTRKWYILAQTTAATNNDAAGMECLSRSLLHALAYAMLMHGVAPNAALLGTVQTSDPQLLSWVANAARVAGNLDLADTLEHRAQLLAAE